MIRTRDRLGSLLERVWQGWRFILGEMCAMSQPLQIGQLDTELRSRGTIDAQHAFYLRRLIRAKETVSAEDADLLFRLDAACTRKDPAFATLYVEVLTDYFVWQADPKGYVTPEQAQVLIAHVTRDGHVSGPTELELLLNVVHWARDVPDSLSLLAMESVRQHVLLSRDGPRGANRPRPSISEADVALLRKLLHAPAGDRGLLVSRAEAEMILSINVATGAGDNHPSWTEFFKLSLANHLLNPLNDPVTPTREEARTREAWLDNRGSTGSIFSAMASTLSSGNIPFADVWRDLDPFGVERARAEAETLRAETANRLSRECVDAEEAAWLASQLLQNDGLDENGRALLAFLKQNATSIDPALAPLIKRAGL